MVKLVTTGIKVSSYRPTDTDDELDIVVRYPEQYRNLSQLDELTIQTANVTHNGKDEIRRMFTDFTANSVFIKHEMRNVVVEEGKGKVATEQGYIGELKDGTKNDMHNCNFFDFDEAGKFKRVIIWMAGTSPLV